MRECRVVLEPRKPAAIAESRSAQLRRELLPKSLRGQGASGGFFLSRRRALHRRLQTSKQMMKAPARRATARELACPRWGQRGEGEARVAITVRARARAGSLV